MNVSLVAGLAMRIAAVNLSSLHEDFGHKLSIFLYCKEK